MSLTQTQNRVLASVIVPVYNGAETLDTCLSALAHQTVDAKCFEVCVVDDGSTDNSAEIAARHGVVVVRQRQAGAAAARNRGAQQSRGQILLFTDADCEPLPTWIEQMLAPFADPEVAGVKGIYRTRQRSLVARFAQAEYDEKYERLSKASNIDFVDTYAAAYRREVFEAHHGFDPEYLFDEDQEFSFRLAKAGLKLVFAPSAVVHHRHPATAWAYGQRKVQLGRWKIRVHIRHPDKAFRDSYTPRTQKAQLALLPLALLSAFVAAVGFLHWAIVALLMIAGLVSTIPLMAKAARQGKDVFLVAPILAFLRAATLDLGLAWGLVSLFARKPKEGQR